MSEIKITDLVSQETIDKIKELDQEIKKLLETYTDTAKELAKGIDINVRVVGDLDKLEKALIANSRQATVVTRQLNEALGEQQKVLYDTTPVRARALMEQERYNKTQRDAYNDGTRVKEMLADVVENYENNARALAKLDLQIKANKKSQQDLEKQYKENKISEDAYIEAQSKLLAVGRDLAVQKSNLQQVMKIEEKMNNESESSYNHLSQQLELLKKTYKELTEAQRNTESGLAMENAIQELDAHLKDLAADMGEFQRNVGNYAIAGQNGVVATESLMAAMGQTAITMQDVADQTKILEEGKRLLDTTDEHYAETLAAVNAQIEENKAKLTDVSDIMDKEATTAAEAEAQNKRLQEAMKHIDLSSEDAQEKIDALNEVIERNTEIIDRATPTTERLAREEKALAEAAKKAEKEQEALNKEQEKAEKVNEDLASQMLSILGINENFASSLQSLNTEGSVFDGLNTKVKAFGKTLMGLLANPMVLTLLGIAGAGAAFKWWYDYNKGLIEASRLTENFTGFVGDTADKVTTDLTAMADHMGKGFDQTIGAANTLVQQFGLSWEDAIQKIQDGIAAGADMNGNLLDNIDKFSGAFHDAGIEADQFIAILAETRNGIFDEKAMKSITDAGTRLRSMTANTEKALDAIGISAKKMQDDLANGNMTMLQAIQQVSAKLGELPPNCQEVGDVMKNVFGRKSAAAGEEIIKSIAGINDNLDIAKENMGELGKVNEEQIKAQKELQETLAAVFKMSGTSFEVMTTKAKTFVVQGITKIIKGLVDVANWFVRCYNESVVVRQGVAALGSVFKALWTISKSVFSLMIDGFKDLGDIMSGIWLIFSGKFEEGLSRVGASIGNLGKHMKSTVENAGAEIGKDFADSFNAAAERQLNEFKMELNPTDEEYSKGRGKTDDPDYNPSDTMSEEDKKKAAKAAQEAEKRAKEELKRLNELEEAKISIMVESHEKEIALIRLKFKKKIDEITGEGETEKALRIQLAIQCQQEVAQCEEKYQQELAKINLENRLASVKKGSEEELLLRLAQLERNRQEEIKAAEKTGADVALINAKFTKERNELEASYAESRAARIEEQYGVEEIQRNKEYSDAVNALKERYAEEMALAKNNATKQEELQRQLDNDVYKLNVEYAQKSAEASVNMIEEILDLEQMSAEDRLKWENKLAMAKIALADQIADANAESVERQIADEEKLREKRKANISTWLNVASEAIGNISSLANALFDGQLSRIEAEQEANAAAGEKEQERISALVDKKVITQEEGEARKRAAEAKTAKKEEELAKKKAQLQRKQAIFQKASDLAQAGIATALAITQALPNLVLAGIAGVMGAIQIATILATPIPQYAKGTDYHKGGPAIVGDGGRAEVVLFNGGAWLTPDTPTLVDMPRGASVVPSVADFNFSNELIEMAAVAEPKVIVNNDYSRLERKVGELSDLIRIQTKVQKSIASQNRYEQFKATI